MQFNGDETEKKGPQHQQEHNHNHPVLVKAMDRTFVVELTINRSDNTPNVTCDQMCSKTEHVKKLYLRYEGG